MPHITVEYSETLDGAFDRSGFAQALHPMTAKTIDTTVDACKTRFWRIAEADAHLSDGAPGQAMVHVVAKILSGRTPEAKAELSEGVVALLRRYIDPAPGQNVHISVDVTDLDRTWYRSGMV